MFVPVIDKNQKPLMPTSWPRAKRWAKSGKATPFYAKVEETKFLAYSSFRGSSSEKTRISVEEVIR